MKNILHLSVLVNELYTLVILAWYSCNFIEFSGYYGWVPPTNVFPQQPPTGGVFMTDAPPPYPGIVPGYQPNGYGPPPGQGAPPAYPQGAPPAYPQGAAGQYPPRSAAGR